MSTLLPDNLDLFREHDAKQVKFLEKLPVCEYCGEPIQERYYYIIDGERICRECLDHHFREELEHEYL